MSNPFSQQEPNPFAVCLLVYPNPDKPEGSSGSRKPSAEEIESFGTGFCVCFGLIDSKQG